MITIEFREKVREAVLQARENYGGSDSDYAKSLGISNSIYSRLKKGETERIISDSMWLTIGRELDVTMHKNSWKIARTTVYTEIEASLKFCQTYSKSMVLVDDCGIGKTFCSKHILRSMKNAFYFDCSQAKTKQQFVRGLAKTIGVDHHGRYTDVKANLKYFLNMIETPIIVLDEAGDLEYNAIMEVKELWNATAGTCAWFMIGADGLRSKIENGIQSKKVGYREIFSRFSDEFINLVPSGRLERTHFYQQLIGDVADANVNDKAKVNKMVNKCIQKEATLRFLETLIKMTA
jgi:hypothetical protein